MATLPQASFRSWIGVAKDTVNANLSAAVVAGATSLPLTNTSGTTGTLTTAGATYSAVIVDGPNTETVALTGNLSAGAVPCAATANAHSANAYVYFQLTASIGPTAFLPATKIEMVGDYAQLYDKHYEGSQANVFGAQQGMRIGQIALDGNLVADSFGYILGSFFGAYDYSATGGSNPTTYAFSPQNTGNGQPPSYLFYQYNPGDNEVWVFAKAIIGQITVKINPEQLITWSATGLAFAPGVVATPSTAFSALTPVAGRTGLTTIGGTINPDLLDCEFTLKREEFEAVKTIQGIQDPLTIFSGPVDVQSKWQMVMADDTQLNNYYLQSQPSFDIKALKGSGTGQQGIEIHCNQANYEAVKPTPTGKAYVMLDGAFTAIANTTDASTAGGGKSPVKVTLSTGTLTGSTLY